jgi:hypothetical protein
MHRSQYDLKQLRADAATLEKGGTLTHAWAKWRDRSTLLTQLYSLRAHHHGRQHLTALRLDTFNGLPSPLRGPEPAAIRSHGGTPVLPWTMADQERLIAPLLATYVWPAAPAVEPVAEAAQ